MHLQLFQLHMQEIQAFKLLEKARIVTKQRGFFPPFI